MRTRYNISHRSRRTPCREMCNGKNSFCPEVSGLRRLSNCSDCAVLLLSHQTTVMTSQYPSSLLHCLLLLCPHTLYLSHCMGSLSTLFPISSTTPPALPGRVAAAWCRSRNVALLSLCRAGCCRCVRAVRCHWNHEVAVAVEVTEFARAQGDCIKPRRPPSFGVKGSNTGIRLDYPLYYSYMSYMLL